MTDRLGLSKSGNRNNGDMNMSDKKNISAAFVKAQKSFAPALKTSTNPHFRSKYADLSACVEAVIDALNSNGIAMMQVTHECEGGVLVETTFIHESGESISGGKLHVPAQKHDAQGYGSALSYARRYSLMAACGIAPEEDDGEAATKTAPKAKPAFSLEKASVELESAPTMEELKATFGKYWGQCPADLKPTLQAVYVSFKETFEQAAKEAA